jgi:hypothetical protein
MISVAPSASALALGDQARFLKRNELAIATFANLLPTGCLPSHGHRADVLGGPNQGGAQFSLIIALRDYRAKRRQEQTATDAV